MSSALDAARDGDLEGLHNWLVNGGDPDIADEEGWTPLLIAAARGHASLVELLLFHNIPRARHADPNRRFPGAGGLPIYMAGQSADISTVKVLLRAFPDHLFETASRNGHTVFLQAAFYGQRPHQQLATYLLEHVGEILSIPSTDRQSIRAAQTRMFQATNVLGQNATALAKAYNITPMISLLQAHDCTTEEERQAYYQALVKSFAPPLPADLGERQIQAMTDDVILQIQNGLNAALPLSVDSDEFEQLQSDVLSRIDRYLQHPKFQVNRLGSPLQRTPLIIACVGADVGQAMRLLRDSIVQALLANGADPLVREVRAMGVNAVIRAAVWGHLYVLERFAQRLHPEALAAALNERPPVNGFTALHDSVLRALSADGKLLDDYLHQIAWEISHGARFDIMDFCGKTQEMIASAALQDSDFRANARRVLLALYLAADSNT